MAADVVTPLMQHALDVGQLFIDNAALKNGAPVIPQRYRVGQLPDTPAATAATPATTNTPAESKSWPAWLKTAVLSAAALASGAGGVGLLNWFNSKPSEPPSISEPASPKDGSLLQYLQDHGYHLPPEERK